MADTRARQYLLKQVEKYFYGEGADTAQGYVPENK
jgi:Fe-S cluster biosynthesis and repair protein YggX